jgi:WD40 repeat protein
MTSTAKHGAFISCARRDGASFAATLRNRLRAEAPDIRVWQDILNIEGGMGWWRQIEEALEQVEFLIIVMTDGVFESEITRKEWRHARQQGVCVYPVKGPGFDFSDPRLGRWMKKAHCYDLDQQWPTFLNHLRRGCQTTRVPFMAPDQPGAFVPRPTEFKQLKALLLDAGKRDPVAITSALTGAGGFGKTTLACALCHDDDVALAFDDGILWTTLGEEPIVVDALTKLYAGLTGERPAFKDTEDAAAALAEKLQYKNCLIVIDDAWNPDHLKPFLRGGVGCARLITTRMIDVAGEVSAKRVAVDEMTSDEAVQLLVARLERRPPDLETFRQLAHRLGEWPLLLKLVGAAIAKHIDMGDTLEGAAKYVNEALDRGGVTAFDRRSDTDRHAAVASTIGASMRLLEVGERRRYVELAVFAEDETIPVRVVADVWQCTEFEAKHLVERLADASLVEFDLRGGVILLHDVLRAYLAATLQASGLTRAHAQLVDRWGDLRSLPHEYAWRRIGYHLAGADRCRQLEALLLDLDWLKAKLEATDIAALLRDFEYAAANPRLVLLRDTLRLSSHVLAKSKSKLAQQLLARIPQSESSIRQSILERALSSQEPWLRPLQPQCSAPGGPLVGMLEGHTDRVNAVALTADGKRAVSASDDHTLKLWDLDTGREVRPLQGHRGFVSAVALTKDGKRAVSASSDHTLKLWDLDSGRELRTLEGHEYAVTAVALTADGRCAVSASCDRTLKLWDLDSGQELRTFRGHEDWVNAVAFTADGRCAVSASSDRTLKVWDLDSGCEVHTLEGHKGKVTAIALTADGNRAVSASSDCTLKLWDLNAGHQLRTLEGHNGKVTAVALTADGKRAVSASGDCTLKLWDLDAGRELRTLEGHEYGVTAVALTADGKRALSAGDDQTLKLWALDSGPELRGFEGHEDRVNAIVLTGDGRCAVSASSDRTLKIWDLDSGRELRTLEGHEYGVTAVALTADGKRAVSASGDCTLNIWDLESGRELRILEGHKDRVNAVVVTADGKRALSASDDHTLKLWDLDSGRELRILEGHKGKVTATALTADGKRAVSASDDRTLKLWDLDTGRELRSLEGHKGKVTAIALTADGKRAVSASSDRTLKIWELDSGRELGTLEGHKQWVSGVALTADGKRAVSASGDCTLKLWDLDAGCALRTLEGHKKGVSGVALTTDGKRAVSAGGDHTMVIWDLDNGTPITSFESDSAIRVCAVTPDGLKFIAGDSRGGVHILRLENSVRQ